MPEFYNDKQEINGKKIVVPYNLLEEMNTKAMDSFLEKITPQLDNEEFWKGENKMDKNVPTKTVVQANVDKMWKTSINDFKQQMINSLKDLYQEKK